MKVMIYCCCHFCVWKKKNRRNSLDLSLQDSSSAGVFLVICYPLARFWAAFKTRHRHNLAPPHWSPRVHTVTQLPFPCQCFPASGLLCSGPKLPFCITPCFCAAVLEWSKVKESPKKEDVFSHSASKYITHNQVVSDFRVTTDFCWALNLHLS